MINNEIYKKTKPDMFPHPTMPYTVEKWLLLSIILEKLSQQPVSVRMVDDLPYRL